MFHNNTEFTEKLNQIQMRITIISFCLLLLISCQENLTQIRVAAYNVEYSKNATATEIGEELKSYNFDVVCFSEAPGGDWTKTVGTVLGLNYVVVGKYSTAGHVDKYKTIASRTPLYDFEDVLMADTLHTATRAKTKVNDTEISLYSVHFPFGWRDQAHIDETTNKIATFVDYLKNRQNDEVAVVMGDFNFIPSNSETKNMYHEMFLEISLEDTWKKLGIDPAKSSTHNAFVPEDQGSGKVIDHIMYNPERMTVLDGNIIEMEKPLSDHKPVWALLQVKD
jgi:endonuclease/exonuclease/phosphatase family metal-dependent hydrolase